MVEIEPTWSCPEDFESSLMICTCLNFLNFLKNR